MRARKAAGQQVDEKDIRKHGNDIIRLSQLLAPDTRVPLAARIADDLTRFLDQLAADGSYKPKSIGIDLQFDEVVDRIRGAYKFGESAIESSRSQSGGSADRKQ